MAITMLRWFFVGLFLIVGTAKLVAYPSAVTLFNEVGVGQWFRYVVGACEVLGAVLLARASTALAGVVVLGFMLVGAAGTEVFILHRLPVSSGFTLIGVAILARALR
jgi:putative oxidoreductase